LVVLTRVSNREMEHLGVRDMQSEPLTLAVSMKFPPASSKASSSAKELSLFIEPMMPLHASPMLIAPSCNGLTRMPARFERIRYLPSSVAGSGAGLNNSFMMKIWRC
jgi:hypothetical protein